MHESYALWHWQSIFINVHNKVTKIYMVLIRKTGQVICQYRCADLFTECTMDGQTRITYIEAHIELVLTQKVQGDSHAGNRTPATAVRAPDPNH